MIRAFQPKDIQEIISIWLQCSMKSHHFIPADYWRKQAEVVETQYLPKAQNLIWEDKGKIKAFASLLDEGFLGALFVEESAQSRGIGRALMFELQKNNSKLSLTVYAKNSKAIRFYHGCGFQILKEMPDEATGELQLLMCWHKGNIAGDLIYHYSRSIDS